MRTIKSIETSREKIPLKTPFVTALRRVESVLFVRVRIALSDGSVFFGEAPATKAVTGEDLASIESDIEKLSPSLLGLTSKDALQKVQQSSMGSSAKAALDIALFFTCNTLIITDKSPRETDITISLKETQQMVADAKEAYKRGIKLLKIKLGSDIEHAIATTKALKEQLPDARLLIDANQAWSLQQSLCYLEATKELALELIEQPVLAAEREALKQIRDASHTPILADEAAFTLRDVKEIVTNKEADMINIKLMKCGGVSAAIEILEFARQRGTPCMLGSMLEGPVSINAALTLAFVYRDVVKYLDLDSPLLYREQNVFGLDFEYRGNTIYVR